MMFFKDFHFVEGSGVGTFLYLEWNIVPSTYWQLLLTFLGSFEFLRSSCMPAGLVLRRSILMWPSCSRPMDVYLRPVRCAVSIAQNDPYINGDRICTNIHPCDHVPTYSRVDSTEKSKFFWKRPYKPMSNTYKANISRKNGIKPCSHNGDTFPCAIKV